MEGEIEWNGEVDIPFVNARSQAIIDMIRAGVPTRFIEYEVQIYGEGILEGHKMAQESTRWIRIYPNNELISICHEKGKAPRSHKNAFWQGTRPDRISDIL